MTSPSLENLRQLAGLNIESARLVAKNENADAELLEELAFSKDKIVRQGVAGNANTPVKILLKLGAEFPQELLDNPVFFLLILENPNLYEEMPAETIYSLVKLETVTEFILEQIVARKNYLSSLAILDILNNPQVTLKIVEKIIRRKYLHEEEALAIVKNPKIPLNIIEKLFDRDDFYIRASLFSALVKTKRNTPSILEKIVSRNRVNDEVLLAMTNIIETPRNVLEELTRIQDKEDIQFIAEAAQLHVNFAGEMSEGWEEAAKEGIKNTRFSRCVLNRYKYSELELWDIGAIDRSLLDILDSLDELYFNKYGRTKTSLFDIASAPNTPEDIFKQIIELPNFRKYCLALLINENSKLSESILKELLEDRNKKIREAIIYHPNISFTALQEFYARQKEATKNINIIAAMAEDTDYKVRIQVAANPETPIEILLKLAKDKDANVRFAVAKNQNIIFNLDTPAETLQKLSAIKDKKIAISIARHPNTSSKVLNKLAKNTDRKVRLVVAKNNNSSLELLEKLSNDSNKLVREAAIINLKQKQIDSEFLQDLATAEDYNTPAEILAGLSTSKSISIRDRVAQNPASNTSVLEALAKDKKNDVRIAVAKNPKTPENILKLLINKGNEEIRLAVVNNPNTLNMWLEEWAKQGNSILKRSAMKELVTRKPDRVSKFLSGYAKEDRPSFTRLLVFLNPQASSEILAKNYDSISWLERYAIARHPNTPTNIRSILCNDANRVVRAAARERWGDRVRGRWVFSSRGDRR